MIGRHVVAVCLVDLRLQHRPHVPRLNADHRQGADRSARFFLKCPQRPSSMVYTVKVHLQRTLADLMFPPHCQSGEGENESAVVLGSLIRVALGPLLPGWGGRSGSASDSAPPPQGSLL